MEDAEIDEPDAQQMLKEDILWALKSNKVSVVGNIYKKKKWKN